MGILLPFQRKDELPDETVTPLTPEERQKLYEDYTLHMCRRMVNYYQATGRWTPACEDAMTNVVYKLKSICEKIAQDPHEQPKVQDPRGIIRTSPDPIQAG